MKIWKEKEKKMKMNDEYDFRKQNELTDKLFIDDEIKKENEEN